MLLSMSFASFYITLGERITKYFYGIERKKFTYWEKWKLIFSKSSHCENCHKNLSPIELFPILGYLILKGKCKTCQVPLFPVYPISEIFFSALFLIFYLQLENFYLSLLGVVLIGHVCISMITDWKKFILDYENLFFILLFGSIWNYFTEPNDWIKNSIWTGLGFLFFFGVLYYIAPSQIGLGDVFFVPIYAFVIGHPWWMIFLNSSYTLAIAISFLTRKKNENWRKKKIPMGFYFGIGFIISILSKTFFFNGQN